MSVTVIVPGAAHLKVPAWMVAPDAARYCLGSEAAIAAQALLELEALLRTLLERSGQEQR